MKLETAEQYSTVLQQFKKLNEKVSEYQLQALRYVL
jgi:hypothetical protein